MMIAVSKTCLPALLALGLSFSSLAAYAADDSFSRNDAPPSLAHNGGGIFPSYPPSHIFELTYGGVLQRVYNDARAMAELSKNPWGSHEDQNTIMTTTVNCLKTLERLYHEGKINPFIDNLITEGPARDLPRGTRPLRIGYFPVAADPLHWPHLLTAFEAMAALELDKVVFIVAGRDARKPDLTAVELRHPMAKATLALFKDFFAYSDIALQQGSNNPADPSQLSDNGANDGETNVYHDLARNNHLEITAFYLVGSDHFNWTVDKGGKILDDTVKKIQENMQKPNLSFAAAEGRHRLVAAFIARNPQEINAEKLAAMKAKITYDLSVVVPTLSYSSTQIRHYFAGKSNEGTRPLNFLPHCGYDHIVKHGLYQVPAK
jgi:hypothetical protein